VNAIYKDTNHVGHGVYCITPCYNHNKCGEHTGRICSSRFPNHTHDFVQIPRLVGHNRPSSFHTDFSLPLYSPDTPYQYSLLKVNSLLRLDHLSRPTSGQNILNDCDGVKREPPRLDLPGVQSDTSISSWVCLDFNELCGHRKISEIKDKGGDNNEPSASVYDPTPEYLRNHYNNSDLRC
jgi:hypothetical protein